MDYKIIARSATAKCFLKCYTNPAPHLTTTYGGKGFDFEIDHDKLIRYEPKGKKRIKQFSIPMVCFNAIYDHYYHYFKMGVTDDLDIWNNITFGLWIHHFAFFLNCPEAGETQQYRVILSAKLFKGFVIGRNMAIKDAATEGLTKIAELVPDGSYDVELVANPSCDLNNVWEANPRKVRTEFLKAAKDIKAEDLQQMVDDYGCPEEHRPAPRSYRSRSNPNIIVKWEDCLYQDIHKAHAHFLLELFQDYPSVVNWVNKHLEESKKAKAEGNKELANYHKAFPNILVGCLHLCNKKTDTPIKWFNGVDTRALYNRCVLDTFLKINQQVDSVRGPKSVEVYSQTDGFIMQHPNWSKVKDSDQIGEFGVEPIDNKEVWTYYCPGTKTTTGYTIYQYFENGKKKVVGDLPDILKEKVDLSQGQVVSYKQTCDKFGFIKYENVEIIKVEEITKC